MIAARTSITAAAKPAMVGRGLLLVVGGAGLSIRDEPMRRVGLRVVVSLMAAGEAFAAFMQVFRARRLSAVTGRPYDAAYHGMVQDFGFYNLAMGLMLGLCAANP